MMINRWQEHSHMAPEAEKLEAKCEAKLIQDTLCNDILTIFRPISKELRHKH